MIRYVFFSLFMLIGLGAMAQQKKSVVNLISSERSQGIKRNGADVIKVYKGVFQQEFSILRSDSAYFYPQINSFDAFGNVHIIQGDTLNIYSDKLNYNGNTHIALLTNNVRMVDKDATLSTNFLTYNTATRIGTYTGGGKLVNKENTLTSKNGYYFAYTRDSYFRYDVVLNTVDAVIKNDTLRYNTGSRIAYFYGPTHIYGKKNKDTLYTENGTYNTVTEQAFFGKKNLYSQSTKSLKGDSLFYDRLKGYGRAVKNVVFNDNEQKMTLNGDLGTYYQKPERTVVTRNPWVTMITEQKDSTATDSTASDSSRIKTKTAPVNKAIKAGGTQKTTAQLKPATTPKGKGKQVADSLKISPATDTAHIKRDTIYMVADTLETRVMTYKEFKAYQIQARLAQTVDTTAAGKTKRAAAKPSRFLSAISLGVPADTAYRHPNFFGPPKPKAATQAKNKAQNTLRKGEVDDAPLPKSKTRKLRTDSVNLAYKFEMSDTARIRILFGYRHGKIFKSDFQGKADSLFYSSSDSTIRLYNKPMMWSEGSQISGDTVYLQLKNKKLDNMDIFPKAIVVNTEKNDTTHFNQVAGKKMKGYFKDSKLSKIFVDGNAETIYFKRDSATSAATDMLRTLSSRIRVNFKDSKVQNILQLTKVDQRMGPLKKFKEDDFFLKSFIWRPQDRPVSKEQIVPALDKEHKYKRAPAKAASVKPKSTNKASIGKGTTVKTMSKDSVKIAPPSPPSKVDSLKRPNVINEPVLKADTSVREKP
ncbi:OstA-like protein [Mucilaginibacter ginkgonis]|uniref:Organic solvent tolerance-like N-terminal domain-containing protein n=1 Tax=Mucilaginibacter ginkgonis TaxID=2682091 RepID=A0A6I4IP67_9SPHI|nr:OstA-like protein [Mucilaginibacter ginkgonis]QQL49093.1 hypothetical protein GO620_013030 [Mucilaginibacter ginkgonis]